MKSQYGLIEDVIFANSFFAIEETGLAYPSLAAGNGEAADEMDAWLRVFASGTRVQEGAYFDQNDFKQWHTALDVPESNKVRRFAEHVFGAQWQIGLDDVLRRLTAEHQLGGTIQVGKLYLKIARAEDPYWRCTECERVHMHRGTGRCTRCYAPLQTPSTGLVEELWNSNFLGRRIVRGQDQKIPRFRLKCEELSGQLSRHRSGHGGEARIAAAGGSRRTGGLAGFVDPEGPQRFEDDDPVLGAFAGEKKVCQMANPAVAGGVLSRGPTLPRLGDVHIGDVLCPALLKRRA